MVGVFAPVPGLEVFLGEPVACAPFRGRDISSLAAWGRDASTARVAREAASRGVPWLRVEHGFLNSPEWKDARRPDLSVVIDDTGIYDDARTPSRLERFAAAPHDPAQRERARKLIELWRRGRLSRYNDAREETERLLDDYVLVIDEPADALGLAKPASVARMLECAVAAHPGCMVLIVADSTRGQLDLAKARLHPAVRVRTTMVHPAALLERARAVYTVGSQLGFEALLWGRPVHTFGVPFYAGWGLTADAVPTPPRRVPVTLEDFAYAALVEYSRYRHPETGQGCEVEEIFDWLTLQRRMRERFPLTLYAAGFSYRKRRFVRDFFRGSTVRFVRAAAAAPPDVPLVVWGRRAVLDRPGAAQTLIWVEDGFLRSVGLGAGLAQPLSWVLDGRGIYYDSTVPSELEHLLETGTFDADLLARAARLGQALVASGITKYNLDAPPWQRPPGVGKTILVPGQVERDASLRYGAPGLRTNLGLLQAVRVANPDAYVIYKPHPDVTAGLRAQGKGEDGALAWCNEAVAAPMGQLLLEVDEVHVLTSLAGFEALLRGRAVTCYGQPFYAGWGLTTDMAPIARRRRRLTLNALIAAALIVYPTYLSRVTGQYTTPERVLLELQEWSAESARRPLGLARRFARRVFHAMLRRLEDAGARNRPDAGAP